MSFPFIAMSCGPEIGDCGSDSSVRNSGSVGEVLSEISILVQEIRVVSDIGDLERNIIEEQVTAVLEILRKSEEDEIVIS